MSTILNQNKSLEKKNEPKIIFTFCLRPCPTAITFALSTFPRAFSGICIPPLVFVSAANRSTSTRSNNGIIRFNTEDA
jgi:hypothetical protein